jgi:hypothetical protein
LITAALVAGLLKCYAQETESTHMFDQYIGIQSNLLVRQIINLNNSATTTINDPYLLVYSINLNKTGWGLQAGIGYNYQDIKDKTSPSGTESIINELSYRVGLGRKRMISKRFEVGYGVDFVGNNQSDKTTTSSVTSLGQLGSSDSSASTVSSKVSSIGAGAEASLNFYITKRLIIGTEATAYFLVTKQKQNIFSVDVQTENFVPFQSTAANSNTETDTTTFSFTLPVALFIIVKF